MLYFDTLDKTGIRTLLVDEDDIERDSECLMFLKVIIGSRRFFKVLIGSLRFFKVL